MYFDRSFFLGIWHTSEQHLYLDIPERQNQPIPRLTNGICPYDTFDAELFKFLSISCFLKEFLLLLFR